MMRAEASKRRRIAVAAASLCALVASLAVSAASATAEEGNSAPLRPISDGGFSFPDITGPTAPEEYPFSVTLGEEQFMEQVDDQEVAVEYSGHVPAFTLKAEPAHAADGANVPTTLELTSRDVVTLVVHHREGNPAAGGAPFVFPITGGVGWEGGFQTVVVEMNNPQGPPPVQLPVATAPPPACVVPSLHGLAERAAKAHLRAAHCSLGIVHVTPGAGQGKVVKQFRAAGTELDAGTPVAVKLGYLGTR
jgi:hypothetical protein